MDKQAISSSWLLLQWFDTVHQTLDRQEGIVRWISPCVANISSNNSWMAHKPKTMGELYSHLGEELDLRLAEAEKVGFGFELPKVIAPSAPSLSVEAEKEIFGEVAQ